MTTVVLLATWLVGTVFARPLTPRMAAVAVAVEHALGLDASLGERKE